MYLLEFIFFHYRKQSLPYFLFVQHLKKKTVVLYNFFIGCKIVFFFCFLISNSESTILSIGPFKQAAQLGLNFFGPQPEPGPSKAQVCCCSKRPECRPKRSFNFGNSVDSGPKHALQKHIDADATYEAAAACGSRPKTHPKFRPLCIYVHMYSKYSFYAGFILKQSKFAKFTFLRQQQQAKNTAGIQTTVYYF